jgi:hypothetical protein
MAKNRPAGGRPPGRRGRGGTGPGPGYRTSGTGRGTGHKSSSSATNPQLGVVFGLFFGVPLVVVSLVGAWLLHGYGLL